MPMQVNITTQVNSASIRRETHNGREHLVLPSYTLPAGVIMNGGLYTAEQIDKHYPGLEGTLAPLGHPMVDGKFVSAFSPEGINVGHIGAWNRNVKKSGNRVYMEKWVDVEFAKSTEGGRELLQRVEALEKGEDVPPIHTSVAAFLSRIEPNESQRAQGAEWVADIQSMDHDAILLHEVGAATPEQGVGLMVNADQAVPLQPNSGALVGESYREREQRLDRAAKERFASGPDQYAWVADFTDSQAVISLNGGVTEVYGYKVEAGKIVFDESGQPVVRQESWVAMVANSIKNIFTHRQARPDQPEKEGDMPLTPEEKAEIVKEIGTNTSNAIKELADTIIKPLADKVDGLVANHKALADTLTANQRAEEDSMREAVKAKFGEVIANSLAGDALKEMFKQCGESAPLGANAATDKGGLTADIANLPKE
ncbi:hypothetical protein QCC34_07675 [Pseudomonas aeruginosa]|uniref:hypothetical protein n=1 Tax=Pseudomonas aeruginosa TaxID=287 RepID=UPI001F4B2461|nr:hypothetical protein [Pseudomonas aeruginosa]MDO5935778.1 hypothetical protein [Pseudomonas aeruginosa]MDO5949429.1 hypothetical protein [Pseudomonas aeruginosa]HCP6202384.1 hypothetical protein [Pseudomonas aeruginosa]HCP6219942.1 hypothetical protein [Pseudomonas aeruginosa]